MPPGSETAAAASCRSAPRTATRPTTRAASRPCYATTDAADALAQTKALIAGGLTVLEITLRTSAALKSIEMLARAFPEAIIGAGTITDEEQMQAAIDAGAAFLVSPGMTRRLLRSARRSPVPFLPGVATAAEAMALYERGFR